MKRIFVWLFLAILIPVAAPGAPTGSAEEQAVIEHIREGWKTIAFRQACARTLRSSMLPLRKSMYRSTGMAEC